MKAIIKKSTGGVLAVCRNDQPVISDLPGEWNEAVEKGELVLVDIPTGELFIDCDYVPDQPEMVLNAARKANRLAKVNEYEGLLNRLKQLKKNDLDTLDKCADAILDLAKTIKKLARGDE